jgi:hypothetical protein
MLAHFVFARILHSKRAIDRDRDLAVAVYFALLGITLSLALLRLGGALP